MSLGLENGTETDMLLDLNRNFKIHCTFPPALLLLKECALQPRSWNESMWSKTKQRHEKPLLLQLLELLGLFVPTAKLTYNLLYSQLPL